MAQTFLERRSETLAALPEWQKLIEHFELSEDSFAYIPLLVQDDSWAEVCQENLNEYFSARKKKLLTLDFTDAEKFKNLAVSLFDLKFTENIGAVWISAPIVFRQEQIDIWQEAWREATARLNQYRNPLREKFPVTFIFAGGFWSQEVTRTMAPDLWSIRTTVIRIEPPVEKIQLKEELEPVEIGQINREAPIDPYYALEEAKKLRGKKGAELTFANLLYRAANGFENSGKLKQALKPLKESITIYRKQNSDEQLAEALNLEGIVYYESGRYAEALTRFEEALLIYDRLDIASKRARSFYNRGNASLRLKKHKEAVKNYDKAIEIQKELTENGQSEFLGDLANSHFNKGISLFSLNEMNKAWAQFEKAIAIREELINGGQTESSADLATAYLRKATSLDALGRYNEAITAVDKAIAIFQELVDHGQKERLQKLAQSYEQKAVLLASLNKLNESIIESNKAIETYKILTNKGKKKDFAENLRELVNFRDLTLRQLGTQEKLKGEYIAVGCLGGALILACLIWLILWLFR